MLMLSQYLIKLHLHIVKNIDKFIFDSSCLWGSLELD